MSYEKLPLKVHVGSWLFCGLFRITCSCNNVVLYVSLHSKCCHYDCRWVAWDVWAESAVPGTKKQKQNHQRNDIQPLENVALGHAITPSPFFKYSHGQKKADDNNNNNKKKVGAERKKINDSALPTGLTYGAESKWDVVTDPCAL